VKHNVGDLPPEAALPAFPPHAPFAKEEVMLYMHRELDGVSATVAAVLDGAVSKCEGLKYGERQTALLHAEAARTRATLVSVVAEAEETVTRFLKHGEEVTERLSQWVGLWLRGQALGVETMGSRLKTFVVDGDDISDPLLMQDQNVYLDFYLLSSPPLLMNTRKALTAAHLRELAGACALNSEEVVDYITAPQLESVLMRFVGNHAPHRSGPFDVRSVSALVRHFENENGMVNWKSMLVHLSLPFFVSSPSTVQLGAMLNSFLRVSAGQLMRDHISRTDRNNPNYTRRFVIWSSGQGAFHGSQVLVRAARCHVSSWHASTYRQLVYRIISINSSKLHHCSPPSATISTVPRPNAAVSQLKEGFYNVFSPSKANSSAHTFDGCDVTNASKPPAHPSSPSFMQAHGKHGMLAITEKGREHEGETGGLGGGEGVDYVALLLV
jgi:hypothetical protein